MRTVLPITLGAILIFTSLAFAADDVGIIRKRIYDDAIPRASAAASITATARQHMRTLAADGSWPDVDYADADRARWAPAAHVSRMLAMARAYRAPGGELNGDKALRDRILLAYDCWIKRDLRCPNWWYNEIGVPQTLGATMILFDDQLSPLQKSAGIAILNRANWTRWTGQNLVWGVTIQIVRGCLENSPETVRQAYDRMYDEIRIAKIGQEGVQADFSFHQHGALLYCGGYGLGFTTDCTRFVDLAKGTAFAAPAEKLAILENYVLDGQRWMTWKDLLDYEVTGRELTRPGKSAGSLALAVQRLADLGGKRRVELSAYAGLLRGEVGAKPAIGNRHFWRSDYMSHRRGNWFTSIRMYSDRLLNTDGFINGENKKSHHLADGATMIYVNGEEYRDIFPVWDWLRIPGTTCEQDTPLVPRNVNHRGKTSFVGGVSDGTFGVAAMRLREDSLEARKAWFCFDDMIVCLGAGLTCPSDNPVYTSINQCFLRGPVKLGDAQDPPREGIAKYPWIWHDSVGYVFPVETAVHLSDKPQSGAWSDIGVGPSRKITRDVFSLWIDHGAQSSNASYQYILMPGADEKATAAAAKELPARILANSAAQQAVWHRASNIIGIVFTEAGSIAAPLSISADRPCLVLVRRTGKAARVAVSNPQGQALAVSIRIGQGAAGASKQTPLQFDLPGGVDGGKSVVRDVEIE